MAFLAQEWHQGEHRIHQLTGVRIEDNPNAPYLTPRAASMCQRYSLLALGTLDSEDNIWCTVWGGTPASDSFFIKPLLPQSTLAIRSRVDASYDPVVQALFKGKDDGEVVNSTDHTSEAGGGGGKGAMIGALSIHLEVRGRVKLYGRMVAGSLSASEGGTDKNGNGNGNGNGQEDQEGHLDGKSGEVQLVVRIEQSLGNCPKYLNKKIISSHEPGSGPGSESVSGSGSRLVSTAVHLTDEAIRLINQADLFFVASAHDREDMDCNHRGGSPGFIRVRQAPRSSDDDDDDDNDPAAAPSQIIWPEYSGNNLYQTLGNLIATPKAGMVVPNFVTGDVLYVTGRAEVLVNADAARVIAKSKLAVCLTVTAARLVRNGLPFRGKVAEDDKVQGQSPYNPRIRYLTTEKADTFAPTKGGDGTAHDRHDDDNQVTAKLVGKTTLTPTITRYRFALEMDNMGRGGGGGGGAMQHKAGGQHVALDFSEELDMGYSHMRDDDPGSLNDDYLRTFTVSSAPGALGMHGEEFEITVRAAGRVTDWLKWQREGMVEVGVRGFGGDFTFGLPPADTDTDTDKRLLAAFVAAGIGITPLLGQLGGQKDDLGPGPGLDRLRKVFWSIGVTDLGFLTDIVKAYPQLREIMVIFLTGQAAESQAESVQKSVQEWQQAGWKVHRRRMTKEDLSRHVAATAGAATTAVAGGDEEDAIDEWYICTSSAMRREIQGWMPDISFIYESFDY